MYTWMIMSLGRMSSIRYAQIRELDISNGEGVGASLFVQGCPFHCYNCFNSETWEFDGGKEWGEKTKNEFLDLINRPQIKRVSILGGEPLTTNNLDGVLDLINEIITSFQNKTIWLYTGYTWEEIMNPIVTADINIKRDDILQKRKDIVKQCNILVDGRYVDNLRDITLKWRGSSNQRVIDVQKSLQYDEPVLYCD